MARTAFTVTTSAFGGTVLPAAAAVDAANGNSVANTGANAGRVAIEVTNGAGAPITVTVTTNANYNTTGGAHPVADEAVTVTNGTSKIIGPWDPTLYNDASGNVLIDWSSGTTITARCIALGAT